LCDKRHRHAPNEQHRTSVTSVKSSPPENDKWQP
jgi:hypothetical protein